jgi:hypothetical protein
MDSGRAFILLYDAIVNHRLRGQAYPQVLGAIPADLSPARAAPQVFPA